MTKAMKVKVMAIINEYGKRNEAVHDAWFHHYGNDYRVEEKMDANGKWTNTYVVYRHNPYGILDTEVATIKF